MHARRACRPLDGRQRGRAQAQAYGKAQMHGSCAARVYRRLLTSSEHEFLRHDACARVRVCWQGADAWHDGEPKCAENACGRAQIALQARQHALRCR
eukprot:12662492-Alexandrium_andersonii.AAC.1